MKLYALAILPLLGLAAWQADLFSPEEASCDANVDPSCCATEAAPATEPGECFASEECAGEDVTCPPGPDCFAPDVCPDEETSCPAE